VTGDPLIDHLESVVRGGLPDRLAVAKRFGLDPNGRNLVVTYHPVTLQYAETRSHITALLEALTRIDAHIVFTYPNADTAGRTIIEAIEAFSKRHAHAGVIANAGPLGYVSLLAHVDALVGNSSSGLIEAPTFELPAVNVGIRQRGRARGANVIDCGNGVDDIVTAIHRALAPETRRALKGCVNPYGDGHAAPRIVDRLAAVALDDSLVIKRFADLGPTPR
jgi:UDP-hydrolysing UDP-N-acetyl-D-glucosamine 2-epimerase